MSWRSNPQFPAFRRNAAGLTLPAVAKLAREMGLTDLAILMEQGGEVANAVFHEIKLAVDAPAAPRSPRGLTDREAWTQLAGLVPKALSDQPRAVQDAIIAEFERQAAAA